MAPWHYRYVRIRNSEGVGGHTWEGTHRQRGEVGEKVGLGAAEGQPNPRGT